MKGCHFQDVPCKRSLCLRGMLDDDAAERSVSLFYCTETTSGKCPHRAWDHGRNVALLRSKAEALAICPSCGGSHRTVELRARCVLSGAIERAFRTSGTECGGSCDPILPEGVPQEMAAYAWGKVRSRVLERDGHRCRNCGRSIEGMPSWFFEVHHVVPRSEGGSDHPRNLVTLCYLCHKKVTALSGSKEREAAVVRH